MLSERSRVCRCHTYDWCSRSVNNVDTNYHWGLLHKGWVEGDSIQVKLAFSVYLSQDVGVYAHSWPFTGKFLSQSEICDELRNDAHFVKLLFRKGFFGFFLDNDKSNFDLWNIVVLHLFLDTMDKFKSCSMLISAFGWIWIIIVKWYFDPGNIITSTICETHLKPLCSFD